GVPRRVLGPADRVLHLPLGLLLLAFGLRLGVARNLAPGVLHGALDLLTGTLDPILVHAAAPFRCCLPVGRTDERCNVPQVASPFRRAHPAISQLRKFAESTVYNGSFLSASLSRVGVVNVRQDRRGLGITHDRADLALDEV